MNHTQSRLFNLSHHHNSTGERDERRLSVYEETNRNQDKKILRFMRQHKRKRGWTSAELWRKPEFENWLEVSVRRALNYVMNDRYNKEGTVIQDGLREGPRGRKLIVWKYRAK